MTYLMGR